MTSDAEWDTKNAIPPQIPLLVNLLLIHFGLFYLKHYELTNASDVNKRMTSNIVFGTSGKSCFDYAIVSI